MRYPRLARFLRLRQLHSSSWDLRHAAPALSTTYARLLLHVDAFIAFTKKWPRHISGDSAPIAKASLTSTT